MFKKVLIQYPHIFNKRFIDKGLFLNVYAQICTRCFGFGLATTGMVPMGDNLNHNSVDITIELVNTQKHLQAAADPSYFKIGKYLNDYSTLFEATGTSEYPDSESELNAKGRFDNHNYAQHHRILSVQNIRFQIEFKAVPLWDILAKVDKFGEDNDSSDEESEEEEEEESKQAVDQETNARWGQMTAKEKRKFKNRMIDFEIRAEKIQKQREEQTERDLLKAQGKQPEKAKLFVAMVEEDNLLRREYVCLKGESEVSRIERLWVDKGLDEEEEETFDWVKEMLMPD